MKVYNYQCDACAKGKLYGVRVGAAVKFADPTAIVFLHLPAPVNPFAPRHQAQREVATVARLVPELFNYWSGLHSWSQQKLFDLPVASGH